MDKTPQTTRPAVSTRDAEPAGGPGSQVIELARNQKLVIRRAPGASSSSRPPGEALGDDHLSLLDADGTTCLTIRVGAGGTVIELGGGPVALSVEGDLAISSRKLLLHGREGVAVSSDGDLHLEAAETAVMKARRQELVATRGNIEAKANDDVIIDGERIRMNC